MLKIKNRLSNIRAFRMLNKATLELILIILIKFISDFAYMKIAIHFVQYPGFDFIWSSENYIIGWIIYIGSYIIVSTKKELYIFNIYFVLFFLYLLPNIVFYSLSYQKLSDVMILTIPFLIIITCTYNFNNISFKDYNLSEYIIALTYFLAIVILIDYIRITSFNIVLNFDDVYSFREKFGGNFSFQFFEYVKNLLTKVLLPFVFAYFLLKKSILMSLLNICIIILFFIFSGSKEVLQIIVIIFTFYFIYNHFRLLFLLLFLILISTVFLYVFLGYSQIFSLLVRRLIFMPVYINFIYLDFFEYHDYVYWTNSFLRYFYDYQYLLPIQNEIGNYIGFPTMYANTGFSASGFMQFGYFGIMIYTIILVCVFNLINNLSKNINSFLMLSLLLIPIMKLFIGADLLTSFFTHGLLGAIIIIFFIDKKTEIKGECKV